MRVCAAFGYRFATETHYFMSQGFEWSSIQFEIHPEWTLSLTCKRMHTGFYLTVLGFYEIYYDSINSTSSCIVIVPVVLCTCTSATASFYMGFFGFMYRILLVCTGILSGFYWIL